MSFFRQDPYLLEVTSPDDTCDAQDIRSVAALAEPVRRQLYETVATAPGAISREQAAAAIGVPAHTAKFHLDRLVDEGLLEVEYRRLTGRTGPGSGRPAKLYRRTAREIALSLPARQYALLSVILAKAIAQADGEPVLEVAERVAEDEGERWGRDQEPTDAGDLERVATALCTTGYEPRMTDDALELRNCPFHQAAVEQTELVCGLNLAFVTGVCRGLDAASAHPDLKPASGRCCVVVAVE